LFAVDLGDQLSPLDQLLEVGVVGVHGS